MSVITIVMECGLEKTKAVDDGDFIVLTLERWLPVVNKEV